MKPREKVVNAHDIQSSLYYCHLASDQDDLLLQDELQPCQGLKNDLHKDDSKECQQTQNPVQMKRNEPSEPVLLPRPATSSNNGQNPRTEQTTRRKPVNSQNSENPPKPSQAQARRVLGPRPIVNCSVSPPASIDSQQNDGSSSFRSSNSTFQTLESLLETNEDTKLNEMFDSFHPYTNTASRTRCITLIRRNPATDSQWNIGRLSLLEPNSPHSPNRSPKHRKKDILIELSTPGYDRFSDKAGESQTTVFTRHLNFPQTMKSENSSRLTSSTSSITRPLQPMQPTFLTPWQTSCAMRTAITGGALKCYHSLLDLQQQPYSKMTYGERPQTALVSELRFNLPTVEKEATKKKENRRPVSFQSRNHGRFGSFDGSIDLSNATTGKDASNGYEQEDIIGLSSWPVLSQHTLVTPPTLPPQQGRLELSSFHYRAYSDEVALTHSRNSIRDIDTPLDLSLGQERAGGGFNGNKAKLGKLIIYGSQGLAMLDLLVAANMAVWFNDILEY